MIAPLKKKAPRWPEPMVPLWIAEGVCAEAARFMGEAMPERYPLWLAARAERCFQGIPHFRRSMRARGDGGRDNLRMFMRHWLAALLHTERPDLHRALPPDFDLGHPLPAGTHPRVNRRSSLPLPRAMNWNPDRVLEDRHWRFLATAQGPAPDSTAVRLPAKTRKLAKPRYSPGLHHCALVEFPIC